MLAALREEEFDEAALARIRCPAGLDLGPSTQEEIAVAILAEIVACRHHTRTRRKPGPAVEARDCRSSLRNDGLAGNGTESAEVGGVRYYFCWPVVAGGSSRTQPRTSR